MQRSECHELVIGFILLRKRSECLMSYHIPPCGRVHVRVCRPGDAALPSRYVPMGTQVGTPAWIPESVEEQVDVANIWFVIIKRSSEKSAVSRAAANGTCADKDADKDADKHNGQAAFSSEQPALVLGAPGLAPSHPCFAL